MFIAILFASVIILTYFSWYAKKKNKRTQNTIKRKRRMKNLINFKYTIYY